VSVWICFLLFQVDAGLPTPPIKELEMEIVEQLEFLEALEMVEDLELLMDEE